MYYGPINRIEPRSNGRGVAWYWRQFIAEIINSAIDDVAGTSSYPKDARWRAREDAIRFFESGTYREFAEAIDIEPSAVFAKYQSSIATEPKEDEPEEHGKTGKGYSLTKSEKKQIRKMMRERKAYYEIAETMGRSRSSVARYGRTVNRDDITD